MKKAIVNGQEIPVEAVKFELDRLVAFYAKHGMSVDEVRKNLPALEQKALEQAIGAKLLLEQASRIELPGNLAERANRLIEQACAHVADPTEEEVSAFYEAHKSDYGTQTLVAAHDSIKDLLRHNARGRATAAFIDELRASATIEYK